jgi:hypothetical protein
MFQQQQLAAAAAAASSSSRFNKYMRALSSRYELLCDLRALLEEALIN